MSRFYRRRGFGGFYRRRRRFVRSNFRMPQYRRSYRKSTNSNAVLIGVVSFFIIGLISSLYSGIVSAYKENQQLFTNLMIGGFSFFGLIFALIIINLIINAYLKNKILKVSPFIKAVDSLNIGYTFNDVDDLNLFNTYDNETFYNTISAIDYLTYNLVYTKNQVLKAIYLAEQNANSFKLYMPKVEKILDDMNSSGVIKVFFKKRYKKLQIKLFNERIPQPITEFKIVVKLSLTNINGVLKTSKSSVFSTDEIKEIINKLKNVDNGFYKDDDIWQAICRVERGKVSNKIRFAIYKRDGYRCKKCGVKSKDLEIDHIYPIAKGGKSTFDNLQTLCHRCNSLKSDTVEYGVHNTNRYYASNEICPLCGAELKIKLGKYGKFYSCPNFPKCKYTKKI